MPDPGAAQRKVRRKSTSIVDHESIKRCIWMAKEVNLEGHPESVGSFHETAQGETGHAHTCLENLRSVGGSITELPIDDIAPNIRVSVASENREYTKPYPPTVATVRTEGFAEIADRYETLAIVEASHAARYQSLLEDYF